MAEFERKQVTASRQYMDIRVAPETVNEDKRTVDVVWTTGARVRRIPWFSEPFYEELSLKREHVRLDRLNSGAPVLNAHRAWELADVIGTVVRGSAKIVKKEGRAKLRFDDDRGEGENGQDGLAEKVFRKIMRGTLSNVSVGYNVYKWEEAGINEADGLKIFRAIDWEPAEISPVPIGADAGAGTRSEDNNETFQCEILTRKVEPMIIKNVDMAPAGEDTQGAPAVDENKIRQEAAKEAKQAERQRCADIRQCVELARIDSKLADEWINEDISADEARKRALEKRAEMDKESNTASPNVAINRDEKETRIQGAENALLHRANPSSVKLEEIGNPFRAMSLIRLAEVFVGDISGLSRSQLAIRAMSTSDFPILLANVANKSLRRGYTAQRQTFWPLVRQSTLTDYKEVTRIQLGALPTLEKVLEGGEYTYGTFSEGKEVYKLSKYGKLVAITEETIINDDLDGMSRIPGMMGAALARLESQLVWGIFLDNPIMGDGNALFHALHGNLGTPAAISSTSLDEMRQAFRAQKDLDDRDFIDLEPTYLVVGPAKETEAKKVLSTDMNPSVVSEVNIWKGSLTPIVESRITGNQWFTAASPEQIDTIEVGYLDGERGPQMSQQEGFEVDGVKLKIKHVVGVKAIDFRGLFKNAGA